MSASNVGGRGFDFFFECPAVGEGYWFSYQAASTEVGRASVRKLEVRGSHPVGAANFPNDCKTGISLLFSLSCSVNMGSTGSSPLS